ncbi:type II/IV secretion system ATPase subunit [Archaeoglobus fulgidus]|uniref:Type II secretion system protein (GspE-3) n=1 Tax=Archaeoglobus fulgidus (strain ATCC 49558 / DSM 4304 / JCM 9628 / NBRC 100126 / VC-16) TaxID=224325 RepID=O29266_ARCFU|nr:type II/IV secretion system ATPase subunit [Archaeoglobus fulgidus]AAB90245.1 type II secretion system protein (gspE-3) [Archaeoglobus fulgidus DSM 4304]
MPKINFRQLKFRGKEQEESEEEEAEQLADYEKEALEAIEEVKQKEEILKVKREKKKIIGLPKRKEYSVEEHGELVEYSPPVGWSIVEEYWLLEPYCKAFIIYNEEEQEYRYQVVEPRLDPYETEVYGHLSVLLKDKLEENFFEDGKVAKEVVLKETFDDLISEVGFDLEDRSYYKIWYYIMRDFLYYDKITPLMLDKMLEDISCNGVRKYMYVFHRNYTNLRTNVIFDDPDELDSFVVNLAQKCGKHISIAEPMVDATMPDGSRIQMTLGREVTDHGSTFTIRKFREEPVTPIDLIAWKTFSSEQMAYLWLCIENKKSLIFAGGTASGKTTSMNAISLFIPRRSKIVTIEDTRELMLPHENWIPAVTRDAFHGEKGAVDMYDLLRAALRQRPEYIIVGEVRGREALTLFQAMATGHTTYSTLHADSISGAIHRLENPPIGVPRPMLEALDIISIQAQTYVGDRRVRRNMEIAEIVGLDAHTKMLRTSTVFQWDSVKDEHAMVGTSKALEEIRRQRGWSVRELNEELERRRRVLEFMLEHNVRDFKRVSNIIHTYQTKPDKIMEAISKEG